VRITEELLEWKCSNSGSRKSRLTAVGIRCADHATHYIQTCGGRSAGIDRLQTKATEFSFGKNYFPLLQHGSHRKRRLQKLLAVRWPRTFPPFMKLRIHYSVYNSPQMISVLSHINSVYPFTSRLFKIMFIIILYFLLNLSNDISLVFLNSRMCVTCPAHVIRFELIILIISGERQNEEFVVMYFSIHLRCKYSPQRPLIYP
jgi:hypothetical protein